MLDAFHGTATAPALQRLEAAGLVRAMAQPPEAAAHWALTEAGQAAAARQEKEPGP
jgi:DNA-binding PadR family transcriptional regulator